ncbi:hypothetical protein KJK34_08785 [Flavobacterium sp. D11R37]|uniref:hypothetical protein n=1 Tax=Flavobacterium coralii TaxID=2838017 RepID=UPI001CA6186F|nr:hypothetical protein [Flavobacterium coralii]MBY8962842.1 hypothetical protein [Flavobacterium coralii]
MDQSHKSLNRVNKFIFFLGSISLITAPLLTFIGWSISHDTLTSFLDFNFIHKITDATKNLDANSSPQLIFRFYLLPHYFIYSSMPFYVGLGLKIISYTYKRTPWLSVTGILSVIIGSIYFIGVLGAYLSTPIGGVMQTNILKISFSLCLLLFVGNIFLGIATYVSCVIAKWQSALFIFGNLLILIFPGIENWMALGSIMMITALFPLSLKKNIKI